MSVDAGKWKRKQRMGRGEKFREGSLNQVLAMTWEWEESGPTAGSDGWIRVHGRDQEPRCQTTSASAVHTCTSNLRRTSWSLDAFFYRWFSFSCSPFLYQTVTSLGSTCCCVVIPPESGIPSPVKPCTWYRISADERQRKRKSSICSHINSRISCMCAK